MIPHKRNSADTQKMLRPLPVTGCPTCRAGTLDFAGEIKIVPTVEEFLPSLILIIDNIGDCTAYYIVVLAILLETAGIRKIVERHWHPGL